MGGPASNSMMSRLALYMPVSAPSLQVHVARVTRQGGHRSATDACQPPCDCECPQAHSVGVHRRRRRANPPRLLLWAVGRVTVRTTGGAEVQHREPQSAKYCTEHSLSPERSQVDGAGTQIAYYSARMRLYTPETTSSCQCRHAGQRPPEDVYGL